MKKITYHKDNKGFTLVELIVVLVILGILAALIVPALLGYIDRAKRSQDVLAAKNMLQATQAGFSELYGKGSSITKKDQNYSVVAGALPLNKNGDIRAEDTDFAKQVRATADDEPYLFIAGLGDGKEYIDKDIHKLYTVYYAVYLRDKNSKPLFYDGKSWTDTYPTKNSNNTTASGIKFQYYIISNKWGFKPDDGSYWNELKKMAGAL